MNRRTPREPARSGGDQPEFADDECTRTGVLGEAGEKVESDDDQRDDRGEQLYRDDAAQRATVDLGEPGGDRAGQALLTGFSEPPVTLPEPPTSVVPVPVCAHRSANSSNVPYRSIVSHFLDPMTR